MHASTALHFQDQHNRMGLASATCTIWHPPPFDYWWLHAAAKVIHFASLANDLTPTAASHTCQRVCRQWAAPPDTHHRPFQATLTALSD